MRGRRKTTAEHQRDGTLKPSLHGNRLDAQSMPGKPRMPSGFNSHGKSFWRCYIDNLPPECYGAVDTKSLKIACQLYQKWEKLKDVDGKFYEALAAVKELRAIMSEFGWTPGSRAKIKAPPPPKAADDKKQFLKAV